MKKLFILISTISFVLTSCSQSLSTSETSDRIVFTIDPSYKVSFTTEISQADLIVNGPLFDNITLKPDGGYIENGKWIQNKITSGKKIDNQDNNFNFGNLSGVFVINNDNTVHIYHYAEDFSAKNIRFGFQSGPILVSNGIIPKGRGKLKLTETIYPAKRAGIGYKDDKIIIIISKNEISLHDFAKMFIEEGVNNALYLDGFNTVYKYKNTTQVGKVDKGAWMLKFYK